MKNYLFTSESVSEGHPDKVCDQISDAILDAHLSIDPESRVAAECMISPKGVVVSGEITSKANVDICAIVKDTIRDIGYNASNGFDVDSCDVFNFLVEQSSDISQGVDEGQGLHRSQGAGDQGIMFGYACNQTKSYMPLPIHLAHGLMRDLTMLRKKDKVSFLRPDAKSQVTVEYENNKPKRVDAVVVSTQHDPSITHKNLETFIINELIYKSLPKHLIDKHTRFFINPTGRFVVGGPAADAGLTGRKIIVDTYGGWSRHGGGAFSGKDPSKVDRSAAYMARFIAKNLVAAGIVNELELQLSYAIGVAEPVGVFVQSPDLVGRDYHRVSQLIKDVFDLTPAGIISFLDLKRPIYQASAALGHYGRSDVDLPWEALTMQNELKQFSKGTVFSV